jgi:hypothetical protein
MTEKKKPKQTLSTFVKGILRRGSYHWKARQECLERCRVERGQYKCEMCGAIVKREQIELDHIEPVVDPRTGFTTWDDYINRLYCPVEGFQGVCEFCHSNKTILEDALRSQYKTEREKLQDHTKEKKYTPKKKKKTEEIE